MVSFFFFNDNKYKSAISSGIMDWFVARNDTGTFKLQTAFYAKNKATRLLD